MSVAEGLVPPAFVIDTAEVPALVQCPCGCGRTERVLVPVRLQRRDRD